MTEHLSTCSQRDSVARRTQFWDDFNTPRRIPKFVLFLFRFEFILDVSCEDIFGFNLLNNFLSIYAEVL